VVHLDRDAVWSGGKTFLWGLAIVLGFFYAIGLGLTGNLKGLDSETLQNNGLFLSVVTCLSNPVIVLGSIGVAWLKRGMPVVDYLELRRFEIRQFFKWLVALAVFIGILEFVTFIVRRDFVPPFMVEVYETADFVPLLWFTVFVMAPIAEEIFFRGFLFQGWAKTWLGAPGTIVLTSILWALMHVQYDWYGISQIFLSGILLGIVRHRTGSVLTVIGLHAFMNLVAAVQVHLYLSTQN
jgi:membrane protease YdiL (CAAX protease family)